MIARRKSELRRSRWKEDVRAARKRSLWFLEREAQRRGTRRCLGARSGCTSVRATCRCSFLPLYPSRRTNAYTTLSSVGDRSHSVGKLKTLTETSKKALVKVEDHIPCKARAIATSYAVAIPQHRPLLPPLHLAPLSPPQAHNPSPTLPHGRKRNHNLEEQWYVHPLHPRQLACTRSLAWARVDHTLRRFLPPIITYCMTRKGTTLIPRPSRTV